ELQRSNARKYPTAALAETALDALVSGGLAEWQDRPPSLQGGRPTRECVLLPQAPDETDETPSDDGPGGGRRPTNPPDDTPPGRDGTPTNPGNGEVSSVSSGAHPENRESGGGDSGTGPPGGFVGHSEGVSSDGPERTTILGNAPGGSTGTRPEPPLY